MKNYSQNNEQAIVTTYFRGFTGTFLDLGANDGETLSNTRALALMGWSGVLVDASPTAFSRLQGLYEANEAIECHQVAIDNACGRKIFHESGRHIGREDFGLLSTLVEAEKERWKTTDTPFFPTSVECVTVEELLNRSKFKQFDFISIDIEGKDMEALKQMDLNALGCKMLCVEFNGKGEAGFTQYVSQFGMKLHAKNGENLIYAR